MKNHNLRLLFRFLLLGACALTPFVCAPAATEDDVATRAVAAALSSQLAGSALAKQRPEIQIVHEPDAPEVTISYHTRKWLVYGSNMSGEWSEKPTEETGPRADGLLITVRMTTKEEAAQEQWAGRDGGLHLEGILDREKQKEKWSFLRRPYWTDYGGSIEIPERHLVAQINISFNNRPDKTLLTQLAEEITSALQNAGGKVKR